MAWRWIGDKPLSEPMLTDPIYWRIYAALGGDELNPLCIWCITDCFICHFHTIWKKMTAKGDREFSFTKILLILVTREWHWCAYLVQMVTNWAQHEYFYWVYDVFRANIRTQFIVSAYWPGYVRWLNYLLLPQNTFERKPVWSNILDFQMPDGKGNQGHSWPPLVTIWELIGWSLVVDAIH